MIKKLFLFSIVFFSMFFNGCATFVKVKLLKPSEINIGSIKKISIDDFTFKGNWDSDEGTSLGAVAGQIISDIILDKLGKPVTNHHDNLTAYPGSEISDKLMTKLMEKSYFFHPETQTGKIEQNVKRILTNNKLTGNEILFSGDGNFLVKDRGEWVEDVSTKNGITIRNKKYNVTRTVNTEITFRIKNSLTDEFIVSRTNSGSSSSTVSEEDEGKARSNLPDWHNIVDEQVNDILDTAVIQFAPHYIFEDREVKGGRTPAMKEGLDYAKRYLWDDAKKSWERVLSSNSSEGREDHINATYNLGIYYELQGNFAQAESLFDDCYKKTGKTEFLDAKSRVQYRKLEIEKLQEPNRTKLTN